MDFNTNPNTGQQRIITANSAVEDITERLDQMNVDMIDVEVQDNDTSQYQTPNQQFNNNPINLVPFNTTTTTSQEFTDNFNNISQNNYQQQSQTQDENMLMQEEDDDVIRNTFDEDETKNQQPNYNSSSSNILIVTNVDSSVFNDKSVQSKFEALFMAYDQSVTFRYLKSFRRVRLDFTTSHGAEMARSNLSHYKIGNTEFRCYSAQIIRPNNNLAQSLDSNSRHLNIPKLTKQFLISPPASPPVGWEPVNESSPCIDVQLISAIANLVPGKVHEIHPGNESQPGIFVEVCEDVRYESSMKSCSRIPRTMSPGFCQ